MNEAAAALPASETRRVTMSPRHLEVRSRIVECLPHLRRFARSLTPNRGQADDMVQETVLRALAAAEQFTPGSNLRAWVFAILRNVFYSDRRHPFTHHLPLDEVGSREPVARSTQEDNLDFCDFRRAFCELSDEQREALALVAIDGKSYKEAAAICDCAIGTIRSRVSRARLNMRSLLSGDQLRLPRHMLRPIAGTDLLAFQKSDVRTGAMATYALDYSWHSSRRWRRGAKPSPSADGDMLAPPSLMTMP